MSEPLVFKNSLQIALLSLLHALVPAAISAGSVLLIASVSGVGADEDYMALSAIIAALALGIFVPVRDIATQMTTKADGVVFSTLLRWLLLVGVLFVIGYFAKESETYSRTVIGLWMTLTPIPVVLAALALHRTMNYTLTHRSNARRAVIVGCNETSLELAGRLQTIGMRFEGFFDDRGVERLNATPEDVKLIGQLVDLPAFVQANSIDVIFDALPIRHIPRVMSMMDELRDTTSSIYYVPDIHVFDLIQARTGDVLGIPVVAMCETPFYGYRGVRKRLMDIVISAVMLLLLSPLLLFVAALIKLTSPGPAIFRQRRYGLDGQSIVVYKFRTMTVTEDGAKVTQASKNDARVTPIGGILRRTSIDELPQLINVLQGRMSLVGPRPHAVAHNEEYRRLIKGYMVRHKVLPGITGWAQVNGCRGEISTLEDMQARVRYDLEYLRRWSLGLDLKILFLTAMKVLKDKQAY
ncbi:MAG: undecaprenyl-phosphate glucose phosphotransferase [Steroidobacteraceae bacterium]